MDRRAEEDFWALTEREKQTLRLIVRGYDAKSAARTLGLSVHTINERLREARRKMSVSSSREAARLLLEAEGGGPASSNPYWPGDVKSGEDLNHPPIEEGTPQNCDTGRAHRRPRIIIGGLVMTFVLGFLALAILPQAGPAPVTTPAPTVATADTEALNVARQWLALLDQGLWEESYRATGTSFRKLNTVQTWAAASEKARGPLGVVSSRRFVSDEYLPAPPNGYEVLKFQASFANRSGVLETVTLDREDGSWRVVGIMIG